MSTQPKRSSAPPLGIYVPAVIFYNEDESIDDGPTAEHVLRLAKGGVTGILVQGSNGEAQHLMRVERTHLLKLARSTLDGAGFGHVIVIAGTGAQSTRETIVFCQDAAAAGAEFTLVLTPSTWAKNMNKDAILKFHRTVADASPIPTMIYNFPTVTAGIDLDSDTIAALAAHPNIVGTKLSCANIGKLHRLTSLFPPSQFAVYPGASAVFAPGLLCGSAGIIGALVNLVPKCHVRLYELWLKGEREEAMKLQAMMANADWATGRMGGIGALKGLIAQNFGYGNRRVRGPLFEATEEALAKTEGTYVTELLELEKSL